MLALTAGTLAIVFTVTNSVGPITMISGGRINDTFGPKKVIFVGGLLFGGGMILSGFATSLGYVSIGVWYHNWSWYWNGLWMYNQ